MNFKRFMIGDEVSVVAHYVGEVAYAYDDTKLDRRVHSRKEFKEPIIGKVTGIKRKQSGKIIHGVHGEGYLKVDETKFYWAVRFGMMNKEVFVTDEDIEMVYPAVYTNHQKADELRRQSQKQFGSFKRFLLNLVCIKENSQKVIYYFDSIGITESVREEMREQANRQNRDNKGRFMKGFKQ